MLSRSLQALSPVSMNSAKIIVGKNDIVDNLLPVLSTQMNGLSPVAMTLAINKKRLLSRRIFLK
jgi:hypothetical protein